MQTLWGIAQLLKGGNYLKNITNPQEPNKMELSANLAWWLWISPPGSMTELSWFPWGILIFAAGGSLQPVCLYLLSSWVFSCFTVSQVKSQIYLSLYPRHLLLTCISIWEMNCSTWKSHRYFKVHISPRPFSTPTLCQAYSEIKTQVPPNQAVLLSIFPIGLRCPQNILVTILCTKYYNYLSSFLSYAPRE